MKDVKDVYLQRGMFFILACSYNDIVEIRICKVKQIIDDVVIARQVRKENNQWVLKRLDIEIDNSAFMFAVAPDHIPDEARMKLDHVR